MNNIEVKVHNEVNHPCIHTECTGLTCKIYKGEHMKKLYFFLTVLILAFVTEAYSQYSESFFSSNPNYKQELEKSGAKSYTIPATVNYKPLGEINWSEGFEDATFPPPGWAVHNLDGGNNTWIRYTSSPIFGSASAAVRWESSTLSNDDWLVTPQFTVNAGAFLNFYAKRQSTFYDDSVEIYYSTSGGVPPSGYNYITTIMPTGTTGELFQISLSSLAGQNVYIAFRYKELDQYRLYLDSVYVETPVALDAGVVAINSPKEILTTLGTTPQIVVKNLGVNPTGTFNAHITITPGNYNEVTSVTSLNSGESDTIDFPNWVPSTAGTYTVTAWTDLSGDMNTQNDTLVKVVTVTEELYRDFVLNVSNLYPGALSLYGVEFGNNYFYVSKWSENKIFRINRSGTTIDSFTISGLTGGLRDLAWDGEFLYGSRSSTIVYKIDVDSLTADTAFISPIAVRGIAYDAANDAFWVSNWSTDATIPASSHGLTGMSGLAYDTLTAGGPYLWVLNGGSANDNKILYKFNASTGVKVDSFLITHHLPESAIGGGVFVAGNVVSGSITLGVLNQGNPHLITGYKIGSVSPPVTDFIKVLSPNGGEIYKKGENVLVTWHSNVEGNVNIYASIDGGTNWMPVQSDVPNDGVWGSSIDYDSPEGTNWKIKVESVNNPSIFDVSDNVFTIQGNKDAYLVNPFVISDGESSVALKYGIDPNATDSIDSALGEAELPPLPPIGAFDGRFVGTDIGIPELGQGVLNDFRQGGATFSGTKVHEIQYQMGSSGDSLRVFWYLPPNVTGLLQDFVGGGIVNVSMSGEGKFTVPNPNTLNKLKITLTYTPNPAAVTVIAPNGGENLVVGSTYNIQWDATGIDNVKLEYTTNNGADWIEIATVPALSKANNTYDHPKKRFKNTESLLGSYSWVVPNTPSDQCKVKVSDATNPAVYDVSDSVFTITGGVVGENWTVQNSNTTATLFSVSVVDENVAWATGIGGVVIRTTNGGQTWTPVTSPRSVDAHVIKGIDANRALVATNGTNDAKIHLTTDGGQTWTDVFTQAGGFINVILMFDDNNGFAEGDPVGGNWTLLKTTDGGATWSPAGTLAQSGGEYGWNNSGWNVGNTIWFGTNNSRVYKSTDGGNTWTFAPTTVANSYAVTFGSGQKGFVGSASGTANRSVDGGNSWTAISTPATGNILGASGLNENEYWFTAGNNVYYSSDHGSNWSTSFTGSNVLYHINVKGLSGSNAVGYAVGENGYLVKYFRGPLTPQLTVVSPNGGENWTVGSVKQIVWNAQAVSTVKLEFSTNNGATWNYIGTAPATSNLRVNNNSEQLVFTIEGEMGVYNWTIPNTPSNQCLVKVSDNSNPAVYDVSDNVFTISTGGPGPVLQFNYDISALYPGLVSAYGSEFDGEYLYLTIWNSPKIFRINKEGTSIDSFNISGLAAGTGIRDLAFDGMYLYGSNNTTTVYRIDRNTFAATPAFTSPIQVRGISYDAEHDAFWVANWSTDIILVSRTGAILHTIPASAHGFTGMSGNAYDTLSAGGPYLWIFNGGTQTDPKVLYKINPQTGARLDSIDVTPILPNGAIGGGLWVTDQFISQTVTLGGSSQATPYRIFGYQIHVQGPIPGTVTVLSPNGGEVFYKDQIQLITWKSYEFDSTVKIRISSDGGNTFFTEISNINNTGVYAIYIPNNAQSGQDYKIRIEAQSDSTKFDESDGTFTIVDAPYTLPIVDLPMVVSDQVNSRLLRFGLDTAATDGIDPQFGEEELPPVPPVGVLDARFVGDDISLPQLGQGLLYDYRSGSDNSYSVKLHELKFQPGSGNDIVINLYLPEDVTARFESFVPGLDTTVSGVARIVVSDSLVNKLKVTINYFPIVGVDNEVQTPDKFVVYQNYPNPFNPSTKIKYGIPTDAEVTIEIYNIVGEKVTTLYEGLRKAGYHETTFDASNLQSGVYFYKVIAGNTSSVKKMLLMK